MRAVDDPEEFGHAREGVPAAHNAASSVSETRTSRVRGAQPGGPAAGPRPLTSRPYEPGRCRTDRWLRNLRNKLLNHRQVLVVERDAVRGQSAGLSRNSSPLGP